jgi:2-methylcitrate dehydratase PrpD
MAHVRDGDTSPTAQLAEFASRLEFSAIPEATIAHVKLSILDTIGCALFGATLPWIEMLRDFVLAEGGAPQATLWGSTIDVSRTQAALVNATAAHSFEFDDIHMGGMIHPGALALGAALSAAGGSDVDGRALLTAIVAGCEVGARVGMSVGTAHFRAGYHPQGTVGVFVAGAAAGRILHLDGPTMRDAIGVAGTQAAGLMAAQEGSMVKRLHSGLACQSGVRSAILAAQGFTGIADVLEAEFGGFASTMGGGQVDLGALTSGLGTRWETDEIGFKPYASCAAAQSSIEMARLIREEMLTNGSTARSVTIHASTHAQVHCGWEYRANGVTAAQMSIPYGVACMLIHGDVSAEHFSESAISDPATVDLARRVTVVGDESIDALGPTLRYTVRAEVQTDDGRTVTREATDRPGGPTQPMPPSAIRDKFDGLVVPLLGVSGAKAVRGLVERLESIDDVRQLVAALSASDT